MMILFKSNYQPKNYRLEEITSVLENRDKKISYILSNWDTKSVAELAIEFNVQPGTILRWVRGKARKKKHIIRYRTTPETNLVLNMQTGIYYEGFSSAAKSVGINRATMRDHIRGVNKLPGFKHWKIV